VHVLSDPDFFLNNCGDQDRKTQFRQNREEFNKIAKEWTAQYG